MTGGVHCRIYAAQRNATQRNATDGELLSPCGRSGSHFALRGAAHPAMHNVFALPFCACVGSHPVVCVVPDLCSACCHWWIMLHRRRPPCGVASIRCRHSLFSAETAPTSTTRQSWRTDLRKRHEAKNVALHFLGRQALVCMPTGQ